MERLKTDDKLVNGQIPNFRVYYYLRFHDFEFS